MERLRDMIREDKDNADKPSKLSSLRTIKEMIAFAEAEDLKEDLKDARAEKLLAYGAAEDIKKNGSKSIFMTRAASRMIPKVVNAARFLVRYDLI